MKKYAILSCVEETSFQPHIYKSEYTRGVKNITKKIYKSIKRNFGESNIKLITPNSTKDSLLEQIDFVKNNLDNDGLLFFYFHGHGGYTQGKSSFEKEDQFLVCHEKILIDNTIDQKISGFLPSQRILSIVDSCSSRTVVEWKKFHWSRYPQVIHISSSLDDKLAESNINGGLFSQGFYKRFLINGLHNRITYNDLLKKLKELKEKGKIESYITQSGTITKEFLTKKMFN